MKQTLLLFFASFIFYWQGNAQLSFDNTCTITFEDISATGTDLSLGDDGEANITIPFSFTLDGVSSSNLRVGDNGGVLFNATSGNVGTSSAPTVQGFYPFSDDLDSDYGAIYWETLGTTPNRKLVVLWNDRPHYSNSPSGGTFELILHETSNEITFLYQDTDFGNASYNDAVSAGIRVVGANGTYVYSTNTALSGVTCINWTIPSCFVPTALGASSITATSASLSWTTGGATDWEIVIQDDGTGTPGGSGTMTGTNPYAAMSLMSNHDYEFYVRDDCGGGEYSDWAGPFAFTTLPSCPDPSSLDASSITATSASLSWTTGGATDWEIVIQDDGTGTPGGSGTMTGTNPYAAMSLMAEHDYEFYVRDDCGGSDYSDWVGPFAFTTSPGCGSTWYDTGGSGSFYDDDEDYVTTVCPDIGGEVVTATFVSFSTENNYDGMVIYDGDTTSDPSFDSGLGAGFNATNCPAGSYYGSTSPGTIVSTNVNGCLTFHFRSDGSSSSTGWEVAFTCAAPPTCPDPSDLAASSITATTASLSWTTGSASDWEVAIQDDGTGTPAGSGTATSSNPYAAMSLMSNHDYEFYVRDFCDPDYSDWVGPFAFTTLPSCPDPSALVVNSVTSTSANLGWTTGGASNWEIAIQDDGTGTPSGSGTAISANPYDAMGLMSDHNYEFYVRDDCGGGDYSDWVGPVTFFTGYCEVVSTSSSSYTDNFTTTDGVANISNTSSGYATDGYENATAMVVSQWEGASVDFSASFVGTTVGFNVWIDWNNDLDFDDTGEDVYASGTYVSSASGSITVPASTPLGDYRMRIRCDWNATSPNACGASGSGRNETEDYTFTVIAAPTCFVPTALGASSITFNSASLSWTTGGASDWEVVIQDDGTGTPSGSGAATSSNPYAAMSLMSSHDYEFYVRDDCGGSDYSDWAGPFAFTTLSNDAVDYCNLQHPGAATINAGETETVYAQVYEPGVTDAAGQGAGIQSWIGYHTADTDPSTWTNWIAATYNTDSGNNDEYQADLGAGLAPGTYYYASRFQLNTGAFQYGGYTVSGGGFWDGTTNVSGVLTINPVANDECSGAIPVTVDDNGMACSTTIIADNTYATGSEGTNGTPGCNGYVSGDVWYSFVAPFDGAVNVIVSVNNFSTIGAAIYADCGATTEVDCSGGGGTGFFVLDGMTAGNTYYLRMWDWGDNDKGTVEFCLEANLEPAGCGDTWTDSGVGGDYFGDETTTFCPDTPGDVVHVNFTAFSTENNGLGCYDGITIYNGNSTAASVIPSPGGGTDEWCWDRDDATPGGSGDLQDRTIVSTDATGCLTFAFDEDGSVYREGWEATISCSAPTCPPTNIVSQTAGTVTSDAVCVTGDGWHHFINTGSNEVLVSLVLGDTDAKIPVTGASVIASGTGVINMGTNGCEAPYTNTPDWFVMKRTWDVTPDIQPSSDVSVRFYYNDADFQDVSGALGDINTHEDLTHYKINSDEEDLTVSGNECHEMVSAANYIEFDPGEYAHSVLSGTAHYAQYDVSSFSGGGGGGGTGAAGALPVVLINFEGQAERKGNHLNWATSSEQNAKMFIVERSADSHSNWEAIGNVLATGYTTEIQQYELMDDKPSEMAYYRLRMVDFDGSYEYSNIINIKRPSVGTISVYPVPSRDKVNVSFTAKRAATINVLISDLSGKLVYNQQLNAVQGLQTESLDIDQLAQGVYMLSVVIDGQRQIQRIVKN